MIPAKVLQPASCLGRGTQSGRDCSPILGVQAYVHSLLLNCLYLGSFWHNSTIRALGNIDSAATLEQESTHLEFVPQSSWRELLIKTELLEGMFGNHLLYSYNSRRSMHRAGKRMFNRDTFSTPLQDVHPSIVAPITRVRDMWDSALEVPQQNALLLSPQLPLSAMCCRTRVPYKRFGHIHPKIPRMRRIVGPSYGAAYSSCCGIISTELVHFDLLTPLILLVQTTLRASHRFMSTHSFLYTMRPYPSHQKTPCMALHLSVTFPW